MDHPVPHIGMRPVHPGEILREDYLKPLGMSANALAQALKVPASRVNDIVLERRGITVDSAPAPGALLRRRRADLDEFADCLRDQVGRQGSGEEDRGRDAAAGAMIRACPRANMT